MTSEVMVHTVAIRIGARHLYRFIIRSPPASHFIHGARVLKWPEGRAPGEVCGFALLLRSAESIQQTKFEPIFAKLGVA